MGLWLEVADHSGSLVFSSNFSIGMNLFFRIAREASAMCARHDQYVPFLVEAHYKFKKEAPSGMALVIACEFSELLFS